MPRSHAHHTETGIRRPQLGLATQVHSVILPTGPVALVGRLAASYSTVVSLARRSFEETTSERLSKTTVLASLVFEELPIRREWAFRSASQRRTGSSLGSRKLIVRSVPLGNEEALLAARGCGVLHLDETPWKLRGVLRWLWTATAERVTAFRIDERRSFEALKRLIGEAFAGRVVSDRMGAYDKLPIERRQICWAHLDRDLRALAEGHPGERDFGKEALRITKSIFRSWRAFLRHGDRARLREELLPSWEKLLTHLADGTGSAERRVRALSSHLLDRAEALWSFADHPDVDPTNNAAERSVRKAVLWRKGSFGSQSESGCRFVERILTATATLRQQGRGVLEYLVAVAQAPLTGVPPPSLVAAPALPG